MELPEGTRVRTTTDDPEPEAERYEWVPDENRTYEELPAAAVHERSLHVGRVFAKWSAKLQESLPDDKERDEQVRQIMLATDQGCIDFSIRFPHRFKHLTDTAMVNDPLSQRHQSAMLAIFDKKQRGEITEDRAKQMVSQLAQRTIMDMTAALPPEELARRRAEAQKEKDESKRVQ